MYLHEESVEPFISYRDQLRKILTETSRIIGNNWLIFRSSTAQIKDFRFLELVLYKDC